MPKSKIDWPNIVIAVMSVLTLFGTTLLYVSHVDAKADVGVEAKAELKSFQASFQEFKDESIDRLARIEQDTKALRHKHKE